MKELFFYNWDARDEWFELLSRLPHDELVRERTGGVGSMLKTLFHIVDVEYSWIQVVRGGSVIDPDYEDYNRLDLVRDLSNEYRADMKPFISAWSSDKDYEETMVPWLGRKLYAGEILRHVIAHEIHHIGQLSIWAREIGEKPVSANFIDKGLLDR